MLTDAIARKLDMNPQDLERASLRAYLESRSRQVETQLFELAKKEYSLRYSFPDGALLPVPSGASFSRARSFMARSAST